MGLRTQSPRVSVSLAKAAHLANNGFVATL
jgi:hypothetical protein